MQNRFSTIRLGKYNVFKKGKPICSELPENRIQPQNLSRSQAYFSKRCVVYTSIIGGKDKPRSDIQVFTQASFLDPRRSSRQYKILSHQYINAEYSLWLDGNTGLKVPIDYLIETYLKDYDIALFKHPIRDCIYEEAKTCIACNLDDHKIINDQMERYRCLGYPEHNGLVASTYVLRRQTKDVETLNNYWWSEISRGSRRDQLSFNYVCWKLNIPYNTFSGDGYDNFKHNDYFTYEPHLI